MRSLAQTLPVLKVPTLKLEEEEDVGELQYAGGVVNGQEELATVASNAATSVVTEMVSLCLDYENCTNITQPMMDNCTMNCTVEVGSENAERNYWTLLLLLFPVFTIFGNILVLMSVYKERSLQTVTNYLIMSLAVADLLLAALVMPFAVYYLVSQALGLTMPHSRGHHLQRIITGVAYSTRNDMQRLVRMCVCEFDEVFVLYANPCLP